MDYTFRSRQNTRQSDMQSSGYSTMSTKSTINYFNQMSKNSTNKPLANLKQRQPLKNVSNQRQNFFQNTSKSSSSSKLISNKSQISQKFSQKQQNQPVQQQQQSKQQKQPVNRRRSKSKDNLPTNLKPADRRRHNSYNNLHIFQDDEDDQNDRLLEPSRHSEDKENCDMSVDESFHSNSTSSSRHKRSKNSSASSKNNNLKSSSTSKIQNLLQPDEIILDTELIDDIYVYNKKKELSTRPANYMKKQSEITTENRTILVDWLLEVTVSYAENHFSAEVIHLTVNYLDRFLSKMGVPRGKLQLLGVTCLMVASKCSDTIPPDSVQMMDLTDKTYTSMQVRKMEMLVLKQLDFNIYSPTHSSFTNHYLHLSQAKPDIDMTANALELIIHRTYSAMFCEILSEMTLLDYSLSVNWSVSHTSFVIVLLYRLILFNLFFNEDFKRKGVKDQGRYNSLKQILYNKEPNLIKNIQKHGVLNPKLSQIAKSEFKHHDLQECLTGVMNLWRAVIIQKRVDSLNKKVRHLQEWFPLFDDLYLVYLPSQNDLTYLLSNLANTKSSKNQPTSSEFSI